MGVEWSRIEPRPGEFDSAAVDRYREEIGLVRERGMVPLVSLHHFTNPSWFQGLGEWTAAASPDLWLGFVRYVVGALQDLVSDWVTINEPNVYATVTHLFREGPPGTISPRAVRAVMVNMAKAHCRAYETIHELQADAQVGFAHHARVFEPLSGWNPLHRLSSWVSEALFQDVLAEAMLAGRFSRVLGRRPSGISTGSHHDFIGLNYYSRTASSKLDDGTFPGAPINDLGWEIHPEGLVDCARALHEKYGGPIWVTENGTCDNGDPERGVLERFRCRFIADHLDAIAASKLPFERYYHWCFVDNWEWAEGEMPRFGIVHNDYETQQRTVKPSGRFLARIIADGGISDAARREFVEPAYPETAD